MVTNSSANIPTGASGTVLQGGGVGSNSVFSTATYPATTTIDQILYSSAANVVAGLANGDTGEVLTATTGGPPTWAAPAASGGVTVTKYTSSDTWTIAASTKWVKILAWSGGSGGGSGKKRANGEDGFGGGGGTTSGWLLYEVDPAFVNPAGETVTIGAGGGGGASQTVNSTNGNNGTSGGDTSVGLLQTFHTSSPTYGAGGTQTTGTGGNNARFLMNWEFNTTTTGAGSGTATTGQTTATIPVNQASTAIQGLFLSPTGGGGGGGVSAANAAANGGAGGAIAYPNSTTIVTRLAGGTAGTVDTLAAGNGNAASTITTGCFMVAGTGGGGGAASITTNAGAGGNGAIPGGGGGGGGASVNDVGNSGAGGDGARGEVWIYEYA